MHDFLMKLQGFAESLQRELEKIIPQNGTVLSLATLCTS
jgi:hypothetical protein